MAHLLRYIPAHILLHLLGYCVAHFTVHVEAFVLWHLLTGLPWNLLTLFPGHLFVGSLTLISRHSLALLFGYVLADWFRDSFALLPGHLDGNLLAFFFWHVPALLLCHLPGYIFGDLSGHLFALLFLDRALVGFCHVTTKSFRYLFADLFGHSAWDIFVLCARYVLADVLLDLICDLSLDGFALLNRFLLASLSWNLFACFSASCRGNNWGSRGTV